MNIKDLGKRLACIGDVLAAMDGAANVDLAYGLIEGTRIDRLGVGLTVAKSHPSTLRVTIAADGAEMDLDCGSDGVVHMYAEYDGAKGDEAWRTICQRLRDEAQKSAT